MKTALSVLTKYNFRQLRPGENDRVFEFAGPGVVVIACEKESKHVGEIQFSLITALSADNDALEVATRLLSQQWDCDGYVFALLASVNDRAKRIEAVEVLSGMCSAGT